MTFTNIKSALNYVSIPHTEVDQSTQVEWASQALGLIDTRTNYESKVMVLEIEDHVAKLPSDLKYISAVLYSTSCPKVSTAESTTVDSTTVIVNSTTTIPANADVTTTVVNSGFGTSSTTTTTTTTTPASFTLEQNDSRLANISGQAVLNNYTDINAFLQNSREKFLLLKLEKGIFASSIHDSCVPNFTSACERKYTIDKTNRIVCDYKSGFISLFYLARSKDESGDILIPNDENLKLAIAAYIHMKYQQMQLMLHVNGAGSLYQQFLREWQVMAAKVKGNQVMAELDRDRLAKVATRGFDYVNHPRVFDNYSYYNTTHNNIR